MHIDKAHYMEEPCFNWIKPGLQDVLYDPASGKISTPNTGKMENLQGVSLKQSSENGKIELRAELTTPRLRIMFID